MSEAWRPITEHAASSGRPIGETVRHHLLEGVLRRVARLPQPEGFVLRGSMLTRLWAAPRPRPANDLDFVGTFPHNLGETVHRFTPVLRDDGPDDGLVFAPDGLHAQGIWLETAFPGVRLAFSAGIGEADCPLQIDVGFGDQLVPTAAPVDYPSTTGATARVWCAAPETMVGWKLHGLAEMGERRWRPKDLYDILLIGENVVLDRASLEEGIRVAFTSRGYPVSGAPAVFGPSAWWGEKRARARWDDFCRQNQGLSIPDDLSGVVQRARGLLASALDALLS